MITQSPLPTIPGKHEGRPAVALAILRKEPGYFADGGHAILIMYMDKSEPFVWVDKSDFKPDVSAAPV